MSQLSISAQLELRQAQDALLEISNKEKITPAEKRQFDALLAKISLLKSGAISDEVRAKQADAAAKEFGITIERLSEEQRARNERREEFRHFLKTGQTQTRSYAGIQAFSVGIARGAGADLVNGNGTTAPQGLLTAAANSGVTTQASGVISATDVNDTYFSLNRAYRNSPKCAWVMSDTVYQMIRAAKDSNNRPLLNMHGDDETLMGKKILVSPSVPSAAGSKGLIFGDLSQYVVRVVKNSTEITRSIETPGYAEMGIALYTAWTRVDANLIAPGSVTPVVYATLHS
jgi:predicted phage gp36 major capsid-like protein